MKHLFTSLILMIALSSNGHVNLDKDIEKHTTRHDVLKLINCNWNELNKLENYTSGTVFDIYRNNEKIIKKKSKQMTQKQKSHAHKINNYYFIDRVGHYFYYSTKTNFHKEKKILKKLPRINLNDTSINAFFKQDKHRMMIDYYFFLENLKNGVEIEKAKGGFFSNTSVPTISNEYDYKKLKSIFCLENEKIKEHYLNQLKFFFRYNGYTKGLGELKPYIEKNCPESQLKKEIWDLYDKYHHLQEGMPAPAFTLPNHKGKEVSLSDYKGKVVVIDIWATWCGGCIRKLPEFLKIKDIYKNNQNIVFLTISIDRFASRLKWKYALPRYNLLGTTNLIAYADRGTFSQDYNITGIPRYFVIDKKGKIVNVYCPTPGKHFKSIIDKTLSSN